MTVSQRVHALIYARADDTCGGWDESEQAEAVQVMRELEAENARLRAAITPTHATDPSLPWPRVQYEFMRQRAEAAEAENARLRAALRQICDLCESGWPSKRTVDECRAALRGTEPHTVSMDAPTPDNDPVGRFRSDR